MQLTDIEWTTFSSNRIFAAMICRPDVTFQILTKRPERMAEYLGHTRGKGNVLARILDAARTLPKPGNWIAPSSHPWPFEPLLGPVDLTSHLPLVATSYGNGDIDWPGVDWVIVGGESGPGARPMHPAWVRSLRDQCQAAGVLLDCFWDEFPLAEGGAS